jgi:hypothetical protein
MIAWSWEKGIEVGRRGGNNRGDIPLTKKIEAHI